VEGSEWKRATISTDVTPLDGVSCVAAATLCVAIDGSGNVFTSTEPNGGASKWTKTAITGAGYLSGVSCPTTSFCTIVDESSHVITSAAPTSGVWHVSERIAGNPGLLSVSCPSSSFCAAIEVAGGKVFTSTSPAGVASTWTPTELEGATYLNAISCASATLCVTGGQSNQYATKEPTGGASKWTKETIGSTFESITDVSCPSESLCVDSGYFGELLTSASPTEGASAWSGTHVDFYERDLDSVSCPTTSFCVAVDLYAGDVITGSALGPANTVPPKIGGEAVVGKTLTEEHGSWTGGPIVGYEYEWQRCNGPASCFKIPGAEAQTLPVTAEDEGFSIRVLERARNAEGTSAAVASEMTAVVQPSEGHGGEEEAARKHAEEEAAAHKHAEEEAAAKKRAEEEAARKHAEEEAAARKHAEEETALAAQVRGTLTNRLAPSGKAAKLANLLKAGGYTFSFSAPAAGGVVISWYEVPKGAHLSSAQPILVATGTASAARAGTVKVKIKLTTKGKQLLRHARSMKLTAKGSFTPTGRAAVVVLKTFTVKH
jgi:hypothetical protein